MFVSFNIYLKGIDGQKGLREVYATCLVVGISTCKGFSLHHSYRPGQEGASKDLLPKPLRPEREVRASAKGGQSQLWALLFLTDVSFPFKDIAYPEGLGLGLGGLNAFFFLIHEA